VTSGSSSGTSSSSIEANSACSLLTLACNDVMYVLEMV
jgi:hypothetical protein